MIIGIYKIYCIKSKDFYIGSSAKCINKRFKTHINELKNNKHKNKHFQAIFNKYGLKSLKLEIIEEINDVNSIWEKETYYIKKLKPSINKTIDAKAPMFKKVHTKEAKLKMSKNHSRHNKGKKQSRDIILKNVISNGGSPIICIETKELFISIAEAARKLNLKRQNISSVIHGRLKTTGKLTFKKYKGKLI